MPPAAVALAVLLHALVGVGIWWLAPLQPTESQEEPIMVMFDSAPSNVGLQDPARTGPPAESQAASPAPSTEPNREPEQQQALAPAQPSSEPSQQTRAALAGRAAARAGADIADLRILRAAGARAAAGADLARLPQAAGCRAAQARAAHPAAAAPTCAAGAAAAGRRRAGVHARAAARPRSGGPDRGTRATAQRLPVARLSPDRAAIASIRQCAASNNQSGRVVTRVTIDSRRSD